MSEKYSDIGVCVECHSDQPEQHTNKNLNMGWDQFPCKFCGGVCRMVAKENRDNALRQADRQRGL